MLASLQRLVAKKMTDQIVSPITRAGVNAIVGGGRVVGGCKMDTCARHLTAATANGSPLDVSSYEDAVKALQNLQSNAELIAKARQNVNKKAVHNIPNMIKYIIRSGLTMEEVDKLSVIHVSGTKGKGSTCAFCERILYSRGYKTGLFTSPHMIEVRERIRINGRPISQELFSQYFWRVYDRLQKTQTEPGVGVDDGGGMPPYFAFLTVLSLHVFLSEGVDVAVVEVGIGGQYDSTNFFRKPVVCGVTSLGLDHTAILGNSITDIAWNKAGIFKHGRPAITVPHDRVAMEVLLKRAHEIQNPLYLAVEMSKELCERQNIHLGIAGAKQVENASLAIQLCRVWEQCYTSDKGMLEWPPTTAGCIEEIHRLKVYDVDQMTVKGLSSCVWPGRAQTIRSGAVTYYLDGAHTKESMEVCAQWFGQAAEKERKQHNWKKCARILLFNATSDRDVGPLLACLTACNFDAALFCTNLLSVMESHNRADQVNKTVTVHHMMDKVDANKSTWDELISNSRQHPTDNSRQHPLPTGDHSCPSSHIHTGKSFNKTHQQNRKVTCDANIQSNSLVFVDHNFDKAIATNEANYISDSKYEHGCEREDGCEQERIPVGKCEVPRSESQTHSQSENGVVNKSVATQPDLAHDHRNIKKTVDNVSAIAPDELVTNRTLQQSQNTNSHFDNGSVDCEMEKPQAAVSMKFSCIQHALTWAAQGKDPLVCGREPEFLATPVPNHLRNVDHVQILVTGSLHLVGGVLGVVDPQMND